MRNPSTLWLLVALSLFIIGVTMLSETGIGVISTSFVKTLGKTLCLCLVAIAMDVVFGYCGIPSLGHFAFFGVGGYAIGNQIFGVVGSSEFPRLWAFADSLPLQLLIVVLVPGLLALVVGWHAFRSRVTGVYQSILTQAGTLALALYQFQNDSGLRGNNGLSGLQNIPGFE